MPISAAPNATKVATSKARTRMMSICGWLVEKRSARDFGLSKSASGSIPAARTSGIASSRIRPLGRASTNLSALFTVTSSAGYVRLGDGYTGRGGVRLGLLLECLACERRGTHRCGIAPDLQRGGIFLAPGIVGLARLLAGLGLLDGVLDHL